MATQSIAPAEIERQFGGNALNDAVWRDIRRFEATALPIAETVWELTNLADHNVFRIMHRGDDAEQQLHDQRCDTAVRAVRAQLGDEVACRCAASFLLHPQCWRPAYEAGGFDTAYYHRRALAHILNDIAEHCLREQTPPDWVTRLGQRLHDVCAVRRLSSPGDVLMCINNLIAADQAAADARIGALLDALTVGDWHNAWHMIVLLSRRTEPDAFRPQRVMPPAMAAWMPTPEPVETLRQSWQAVGAQVALHLLARIHTHKQLTMPLFRRLLEALPDCLPAINQFLNPSYGDVPSGQVERSPWLQPLVDATFRAQLQELVDGVLWELISDFRPEAWPVLCRLDHLRGGRYLLRLAEEMEQRGLPKLQAQRYSYLYNQQDAASVLAALLGKLQRHEGDDSAALVGLLRKLSVPTLLAILPHARPYEAEICAALAWEGSLALVELLHQLEQHDPARSTDPSAGVVHRGVVLKIVERLGAEHTRIVLDAFAQHRPSAVVLVQATLGWNRTEVRRSFGRRQALAARALPLLPFEKGDTLLKRYLALASYQREANSSRAGRKAVERAAAQAGLANLALHAGFADATRLEWAMNDELGAQGMNLGRQWDIEGYTLTLVQRDGAPVLEVHKGARPLKRMPSAVTRDYAYREVRTTLDQLKDQQRRLSQAFLHAMRRGDPLRPDELSILMRNPLAVALLERLVLQDEAGSFGLFRAEDSSLEGYHGERVRISGAVRIAHPYDLAQADVLGDWQTEIVRRQIVQPFKQVFRELYLLTPAEAEAGYSSQRFAGRRLKGRQAAAVLANLGWQIDGGDEVHKPLYDLGYAAHFETGSYWYYGDDGDDVGGTTGTLSFWPLNASRYEYGGHSHSERRVKLADVPPRVLSEVLRDIDLVTVVAHQSDEHGSSREVLHRRGDLVRATAAALGLAQVEVEEPYVRVHGHRASYRIHLATAAIHIESGAYLCIVPDPKTRKATYLPFEDGGDPVSSELVSKTLMLANDMAITDPTILAQITPPRRAA